MISDEEEVTMIDFPQMVSTDHLNAVEYFDRDVICVQTYFRKRFGYASEYRPRLHVDTIREGSIALDKEVSASGFTREMQQTWEKLLAEDHVTSSSASESAEDSADSQTESDDDQDEEPAPRRSKKDFAPKIIKIEKIQLEEKEQIAGDADFLSVAAPIARPVGGPDLDALQTPTDTNTNTPQDDANRPSDAVDLDVPHTDPTAQKKGKKTNEEIQKEIMERKKIQKKVQGQLRKENRRKLASKNDHKNRAKRALKAEIDPSDY